MKNLITSLLIALLIGHTEISHATSPASIEDTVKWINAKSPLICQPLLRSVRLNGRWVEAKEHSKFHIDIENPSIVNEKYYRGRIDGGPGYGSARWHDKKIDLTSYDQKYFAVRRMKFKNSARTNYDDTAKYQGFRSCTNDSKAELMRLSKALRHLTKLVKEKEPF